MGGMKLDGAGAQKMKTLEEAHLTIARMNAMIENSVLNAIKASSAPTPAEGSVDKIVIG